ncbi:MAG: molybdopterin biosynthesis protein [Tindallia sp. MSAO_Bac2]|nr:MAG: molybdopterin biosynthesis protein [Tindallia sp. MSAO_Bac2]
MSKKERNLYLTNVPLKEAIESYIDGVMPNFKGFETEIVPVSESFGRKTAQPVFAEISAPHYNAAAMDGIAIHSEVSYGATETTPVLLKEEKDYQIINTGTPLKPEHNAVIMIEDVVEIDEETLEIRHAASPWQHVRPVGEDIVKGELILSESHIIRPQDIGALLSGGVHQVEVVKQMTVGIIPTGSEITELMRPLPDGKIIESNSKMFRALLNTYGALGKPYPIVIDDPEQIGKAIAKAVNENDMVVVNAGSSAGTKDYTVDVLREMGTVHTHGVAIKPGKPVILAEINGKPVVGIPGYPVSAYVVFEQIIRPLVYAFREENLPGIETLKAKLVRRIVSSLKHEEFIRVKLGKVDNRWIVTPLNRGAGVTMSLVRADGILRIPQASEGYDKGAEVEVELSRPLETLSNTLVSIGSHDLVMDLLANDLHKYDNNLTLSSAHVGSMGGIISMKQKECHLAPVHLLEEKTGVYNLDYVRKYFPGEKMCLIKLVKRSQGLMVRRGNPKNISALTDLNKKDVMMVNRQKGAGTRILLDHLLKKLDINPELLQGYEREMTTHMSVAAAVKTGTADCGMGVESAAKAMELDFIPVAWEDYDLLIRAEMIETEEIIKLLNVIKGPRFQDQVMKMSGYDCSETGNILAVE